MLGFEPGRVAPDEFYKVRDKVLELGKEAKIWVGVDDGMEEEWGREPVEERANFSGMEEERGRKLDIF